MHIPASSSSTTSSPVSGNGVGTKAGSDDGCYCSSDMSSEQSNNLLLLNASSLTMTNTKLSAKHVRFTENHTDGALKRFENLYGSPTTSDHCASYVWSVNLHFLFLFFCVYVFSLGKRTVGRCGSSIFLSQVATIDLEMDSDDDDDDNKYPHRKDINACFRLWMPIVSFGKVSRRHWACRHTSTCSLLTIRLSLLCAAMIIIHLACVCVLLEYSYRRETEYTKELTISLLLSLSLLRPSN